jgi:DNA-binding MarR family transcriptional regulator
VSSPSRPRTPTVPAADEVAAGLRLSTTRLARRLRTEAEIGLTPSLLSALAVVHVHGPLTLGALAELEGIAPPTVTKIVGKLQDQDLVERITDAADRRVCRVVTTTSGEDLLARSRARKTAWLADRLDGLSTEDLVVLDRAARIIDDLLVADRTPRDPDRGHGAT